MTTAGAVRMRKWRAKQYAAGKHFVRGQLIDGPRKQRQPNARTPYPPEPEEESDE